MRPVMIWALPMGAITIFEPSSAGELLVGEQRLRDYAEGQDIEIELVSGFLDQAACILIGGIVGDDHADPDAAASLLAR